MRKLNILVDNETRFSKFHDFKETLDAYSNDELLQMVVAVNFGRTIPLLHDLAKQAYSDYEVENDKIKYLLSRGYDVNKLDENGFSALGHAFKTRNLTTAIILLEHGADASYKPVTSIYDGPDDLSSKCKTMYDTLFDAKGNYYDFEYRGYNRSCIGDPNSHRYKRDEKIMRFRLKKIRNLCKPEFEGKQIFKHNTGVNTNSLEAGR